MIVVVPLKPGAREAVEAILKKGPPFDPASIDGLERHDVFLTEGEAVFVFEARAGAEDLAPLLPGPKLWDAVAAWRDHVAAPPRIAEDIFSWTRGEPPEDVSFLPTPGPGDSDGGDVF